jgi:hypothetical protein
VSALEKRVQEEPPFPDGSPCRRTIRGTSQILAKACNLDPKGAQSQRGGRLTRTFSQHGKHQRVNDLGSQTFWIRACDLPHCNKHMARGDNNRLLRKFETSCAAGAPLRMKMDGLFRRYCWRTLLNSLLAGRTESRLKPTCWKNDQALFSSTIQAQ